MIKNCAATGPKCPAIQTSSVLGRLLTMRWPWHPLPLLRQLKQAGALRDAARAGCRFGNESRSALADMRLSAEATGPWPLETAWERVPDGATMLTYSASKAGAARSAARSWRGQAVRGAPS